MKKNLYILCIIIIIFLFGCSNSKDTLCIGDSLFSGFQLSNNSSVVQILNKEFDYRIIDSCVLGYTTNVCVKQLNNFDLSNISFAIIELTFTSSNKKRIISLYASVQYPLFQYFEEKQ